MVVIDISAFCIAVSTLLDLSSPVRPLLGEESGSNLAQIFSYTTRPPPTTIEARNVYDIQPQGAAAAGEAAAAAAAEPGGTAAVAPSDAAGTSNGASDWSDSEDEAEDGAAASEEELFDFTF